MATRWPEPSFEGLETTSPVELANNFEDYYKDVFMYTLKNPTAAAPARYVMDIMFQANKIMTLMKSEIAAPAPGSGYVAASVNPNPNPNPNPQPEELKREEVDVDVLPMADPFAEAYNAPPAPPIPDPAARFEQMMANLDQSTRQFHVDDREDGHDGNHGNDRDGVEDGAAEYFRPADFMDNAIDSEEDSDWDNESETDSEFYEYSEGSDAESEEETDSDSEQYEYTEGSAVDTEEECEAPEPEHPQPEHPKPEQLEEPHEADDEKEPDEETLEQVPNPTPIIVTVNPPRSMHQWVKIRWDYSASPFRNWRSQGYTHRDMTTMIERAMAKSENLEGVAVSAVRPYRISGDVDMLFSSDEEKEKVIRFSSEWLPYIWGGTSARLPCVHRPPRRVLSNAENTMNTMRGIDVLHSADNSIHKQPDWQADNSPSQSQLEYDMRIHRRREKQRGKRQRQKVRKQQRENSFEFAF